MSFVIVIRLALPKSDNCTFSSCIALSSLIKLPPVSIAMSDKAALRLSPKEGALTAATCNTPRFLFTTNVAKASPSTSSAKIIRGEPVFATVSKMGTRSDIELIFLSVKSKRGFSNSQI